jgi:hypothetical protein
MNLKKTFLTPLELYVDGIKVSDLEDEMAVPGEKETTTRI